MDVIVDIHVINQTLNITSLHVQSIIVTHYNKHDILYSVHDDKVLPCSPQPIKICLTDFQMDLNVT